MFHGENDVWKSYTFCYLNKPFESRFCNDQNDRNIKRFVRPSLTITTDLTECHDFWGLLPESMRLSNPELWQANITNIISFFLIFICSRIPQEAWLVNQQTISSTLTDTLFILSWYPETKLGTGGTNQKIKAASRWLSGGGGYWISATFYQWSTAPKASLTCFSPVW